MYGDAGLREGTKFGPHMTEPRSFNARHPVQHGTELCATLLRLYVPVPERMQAKTHANTLYWSCSAST